MAHNLVRFDPFPGFESLRKELFDDDALRALRSGKLPTTDVYMDGDKSLVVEAHLPRFEDKDISVNVDGGSLVIQAERHEREEDKKKKYVVRESSSSFYRSIVLPEQADENSVTAEFDKGVLTVRVPLVGLPSPKKIEITSGSSA